MKKMIVAIICLTVIVTAVFAAGKIKSDKTTTESDVSTTQTIENQSRSVYLGYFKNKAFNPYKTDSFTNLNISTLLYDPLFIINDDWSSDMLLAKEIQNDGKQVTVKIVDGEVFSNGASLTAYDVVYSFNLAKKSQHFKGRLSNIATAVAGVDTVTFALNSPDVYVQQCLTFPIIQNGTGDAALPVGSGRYVLRSINGEYVLSENPTSTRKESMSIPVIGLTEIDAESDEIYRIQAGHLSYFCDDMDSGVFTKLNASTMSLPTNNLIYLGYNSANEVFADKNVINAIVTAIDKNTLADTVFDSFCTLTETPFNPNWAELDGVQLPVHEYNLIQAGNILDESGIRFSAKDKNFRYDTDGYFEIKIIVNKESLTKVNCAKFIGKNLQNLGVKVTLSSLSFEDFQQALKDGDYDLYIGEVKTSPNMDLSAFFKSGGAASYGISSKTVASAYNDLKTGSIDVNTFISVFEEEKPFIPICFRTYVAYYSNDITYEGSANVNEPFRNINTWKTESGIIG